MKKRFVSVFLIVVLLISATGITSFADGDVRVFVNNNMLEFDVKPQIINNRTMVPMRVIFEALGAKVTWDETTNTANALNEVTKKGVSITVGASQMTDIRRNVYTLDSPAIIENGRTLIPLRAVSEVFGCEVFWDENTRTVNIFSEDFVDFSKVKETQTVIEAKDEKELLEAIGDNTKIILTSDYYNFSDVSDIDNSFVERQIGYDNSYNDSYIVKNVVNLTIDGNAKIVTDDLWADVLSFENCGDVTLAGLTVGHTESFEQYRCEGAVTRFINCDRINIDKCNLFGCGAFGIYADNVKNLKVTNTKIYDCSYTGIWLTGKSSADVINTEFSDSTHSSGFLRIDSSVINCTDCIIRDIECVDDGVFIDVFDYLVNPAQSSVSPHSSVITFSNCSFLNNTFKSITNIQKNRIRFNDCTFENINGETESPYVVYNNCNIQAKN